MAGLQDNSSAAVFDRSPFDEHNPGADIILRTSDKVDFYLHKLLLSLASPVFTTMFTLPQPSYAGNDSVSEAYPVVDVMNGSGSLYHLLTWCDPRCVPMHETLEDFQIVLEAADMYGMTSVMKHAEGALKSAKALIETEPVRAFAIAMRFHLDALARLAAKETLRHPLEERPNIPELKYISGTTLQHLHDYYFACRRAAKQVVVSGIAGRRFYWDHGMRNFTDHRTQRCGWWMDYQKLVGEALHSRPRGATIVEPAFMAQSFKTSIAAATDCPSSPSCQCGAFPDVVVYSKMLADKVEKAIETVSYEYTNQHDTQLVPSDITGSRIVHHPAVQVIGVVEVDHRGFWELMKNARACFDTWE